MTVEEIFAKISAHMVKGLMVHENIANMYQFLALDGYKCCHDYHFLAETISFRKLNQFYIDSYNKLILDTKVDNPDVIPESWYKHTRFDIDSSSKRTYIKNILNIWHDWEAETHKFYCEMCENLKELKEYSAANYIKCLIRDVEDELLDIEHKQLKLMSVDYSMTFVVQRQKKLREKYSQKKKELL